MQKFKEACPQDFNYIFACISLSNSSQIVPRWQKLERGEIFMINIWNFKSHLESSGLRPQTL